jgi:cytochrome c556
MKFFAVAFPAALLMASVAAADPIEDREELMEGRADQMKILVPIAQARQPFDAATVMAALQTLNENAQAGLNIDALWPEGSEGGDTLPAVWTDRAGFQAAAEKFATDVSAAVEANPQDLESYQAAFRAVAANCSSCHENFRDPDED